MLLLSYVTDTVIEVKIKSKCHFQLILSTANSEISLYHVHQTNPHVLRRNITRVR